MLLGANSNQPQPELALCSATHRFSTAHPESHHFQDRSKPFNYFQFSCLFFVDFVGWFVTKRNTVVARNDSSAVSIEDVKSLALHKYWPLDTGDCKGYNFVICNSFFFPAVTFREQSKVARPSM